MDYGYTDEEKNPCLVEIRSVENSSKEALLIDFINV